MINKIENFNASHTNMESKDIINLNLNSYTIHHSKYMWKFDYNGVKYSTMLFNWCIVVILFIPKKGTTIVK